MFANASFILQCLYLCFEGEERQVIAMQIVPGTVMTHELLKKNASAAVYNSKGRCRLLQLCALRSWYQNGMWGMQAGPGTPYGHTSATLPTRPPKCAFSGFLISFARPQPLQPHRLFATNHSHHRISVQSTMGTHNYTPKRLQQQRVEGQTRLKSVI